MKKKEAIAHFDEVADFLCKSKIMAITSDDKEVDTEMFKHGIICGLSYAHLALSDDIKVPKSVEKAAFCMFEACFKDLHNLKED